MNFDKESKSREFFFLGGGEEGGGGGGDMNTKPPLQARHSVTTSSTEPYSLMKICLTVFKIECDVVLTIKGR